MQFVKFDIAQAYTLYYCYWHSRGLTNRDRQCVSGKSIAGFEARTKSDIISKVTFHNMSENAREIYLSLIEKWESPQEAKAERKRCYERLSSN